jgi:membrane fusion protein (multidrug efflux system)
MKFLALGALAAAASCGPDRGSEAAPPVIEERGEAAAGARALRVETIEIEPSPFTDLIEVTAVLEPWSEVTVSTELGGLVREVEFEKGERVREGAVLARIGDDLARARLEQAQADLMAAEANYKKVSQLAERQAVPQQDLVAATSRRDLSRAQVREAELMLERSILRAPIAGVVVDRDIDPGEFVAPGTPIAQIQQTDRLEAKASVPDTEVAWLERGREGTLRVDAWPDRVFPAELRYLAPAADPESRTFTLEFAVPNPEGRLRPGLVGRVAIVRRKVEQGVVVPLDAIVTREEGTVAYVVTGECRAEQRLVEIATTEGDRALVDDGLAVGERLVVAGQRDLRDGQPVVTEWCP